MVKLTTHTRLYFRFSTDPALVGYGSEDERERAEKSIARADADAIGTIATLPSRIEECLRRAGLWGSTTYQAYRITTAAGVPVTRDDFEAAMVYLPESCHWHLLSLQNFAEVTP